MGARPTLGPAKTGATHQGYVSKEAMCYLCMHTCMHTHDMFSCLCKMSIEKPKASNAALATPCFDLAFDEGLDGLIDLRRAVSHSGDHVIFPRGNSVVQWSRVCCFHLVRKSKRGRKGTPYSKYTLVLGYFWKTWVSMANTSFFGRGSISYPKKRGYLE